MNTKYIRQNSRKYTKKYSRKNSRKNTKILYNGKHKYFINYCRYDNQNLNYSFVVKYLKRLGCIPDITMNKIRTRYNDILKTHKKITTDYLCNFTSKAIELSPINDPQIFKAINADIFFYNINSGFLDKRLYPFKKYLANVLNINFARITNKDVIYDNISDIEPEIASKYFIKTFPINQIKEYKFPGWYILRPNYNFGGADIKYISSQKELDSAIEYYKTHKNHKGDLYGNNVAASIYLSDLLLFRGKKMHLRMFYVVSCLNGIISSFLLDFGKIITAAEPFDMNHPFTIAKHDSHLKYTGADLTIKKDFTTENIGISGIEDKWNDIYKRCQKMCSGITKMIISKTNGNILFENQRNGYHLFGLDVFITKDLEPIFIESNQFPGGMTNLSIMLFEWINSVILEPLLKYDKPMPMKAREHKTYIHIN